MTGTEKSNRPAASIFKFTPAEFSRLEVALLHGAVRPNPEAHYPVGFFPEAVAVLEAAQQYSTQEQLSGLCAIALTTAKTLREQGEPLLAIKIDTAILGRADVFDTSAWDAAKKSAAASWQLCAKLDVATAWTATSLMGRALRSHQGPSAPVDINALVDAALAVVESEKSGQTAPRSAPALA